MITSPRAMEIVYYKEHKAPITFERGMILILIDTFQVLNLWHSKVCVCVFV
jgi:hypothetical protein